MGMLFKTGAMLDDLACSKTSPFRGASTRLDRAVVWLMSPMLLTNYRRVGLRGAAELSRRNCPRNEPAGSAGGAIVMDPELLISTTLVAWTPFHWESFAA